MAAFGASGAKLSLAGASTVRGCSAESGAALWVNGSAATRAVVTIAASTVELNTAAGKAPHGGGLTAYYASVSLANATVRNNTVSVETQRTGPFDRVAELSSFGGGAGGGLFLVFADLSVTQGSQVRAFSSPALLAVPLTPNHARRCRCQLRRLISQITRRFVLSSSRSGVRQPGQVRRGFLRQRGAVHRVRIGLPRPGQRRP